MAVSVIPQLPRIPENGIHSVILPAQRNSFRPKKKLTRIVNGLSNNQDITKQFSIPPQLFWTSKTNSKKHNFTIPRIIIDKVEDERPWDCATNAPIRRLCSYTRPGLNCNAKLLHPAYTVCAAVAANDPGALKNIILSGTVNIDQLTSNGASALHEAAYDGKVGCLIALLQCGADVNIEDGEGWTPLHAAVCGQSTQCAELLVRRGANVKAKTDDGLSPLAIAMQQKDTEMIKLLTFVSNRTQITDKPKRSYKQAKEFFAPIFV